MSQRKKSTLFTGLMISVALPVIIIFSVVAFVSYIQLRDLFEDISKEKVDNLREELMSVIDFQDVSMSTLSKEIEHEAQEKMKRLRFDYFSTGDSIETADLSRIRKEIGMKETDDIYIINKSGIIINTTFLNDLNFNLFNVDDKKFVNFLKDLFQHDFYTPEPLSLEHSTRKFKKYIYQRSKDHNYIIQLGFYLTTAEIFNQRIAERLKEIENKPNDIKSIDLIVAPWDPISFYSREEITGEDEAVVKELFNQKISKNIENNGTISSYIYFERIDSESIQWSGILKVIYDKQRNKETLNNNLIQKIGLFGIGIGLLFIILFINVRTITKPVSELSNVAGNLGKGNFSDRAVVQGSKEISLLAQSFNQMAENIEKSHLEITLKNQEITASINYAKRIQEAIMPPFDFVNKHIPEYFIYYRPKDIVAGDFYWFEKSGDDLYIAAADCTGHGVPGAMVSVVCSNALHRAVKELKLKEPADILNKVRQLVIETFEKSEHEVKDGMDICFCKINLRNKKISYSGAQNSLYRVTNKPEEFDIEKSVVDENNILIEYKADKQPIGKFLIDKPFSQKEIQCEEGDMIYLFTDGYADQFGGKEGKKFMYKPFKKLLLSLKNENIEEQKVKLNKTFENWVLNEKQIDDICIIGIRMNSV